MGKTPGMQPRPKREHSGTSPSSANRKRPPGPWPESVVSSVPCSQTYTNILPLLCVSLAPSIARRGAFVNRRVTGKAPFSVLPTPCPLPRLYFFERGHRAGAGGGRLFYISHSKGGAMVASGDRPSPTEPAGETVARQSRAGRGLCCKFYRGRKNRGFAKQNGSFTNSQAVLGRVSRT